MMRMVYIGMEDAIYMLSIVNVVWMTMDLEVGVRCVFRLSIVKLKIVLKLAERLLDCGLM